MLRFLFCLLASVSWLSAQVVPEPLERLQSSPRHHEWVNIPTPEGRPVRAFLVYPEVAERATAVLVIHENRGLNDWARAVADQLAAAGYIALAPDLLTGKGPDGGGTSSFPNEDAARTALYTLDAAQVTADMQASLAYLKQLPAANGKLAVLGFCWGGSQAWQIATASDLPAAVLVCYGTGPSETSAYTAVSAPVYGFYGGNDARVNATIEGSAAAMQAAGKTFVPVIYPGAGHAFFRLGENSEATAANREAHEKGWERILKLLGEL